MNISENIIVPVVTFFNHPVFIIIGGITVSLGFIAVVYRIICWFFSITPIVFKLGNSLRKRKVAIFGSNAAYQSLKLTLTNSKIFEGKKINHIENDVRMVNGEAIFLVDWETFGARINEVFLARTNIQTTVIIFAKPSTIPQDKMTEVANKENTVIVNFRGRLLNDILTSLITTSYE